MTISDERWFAEQDRLARAKGRGPLAFFLGVLALVVALWSAVSAVLNAAVGPLSDDVNSSPVGGLLGCAVAGLLGAYSVRVAARAYGAPVWARWLCGLPGGVTAAGVLIFEVLWAVYV